jgi:P4 family phage/plasmid primase-like protien
VPSQPSLADRFNRLFSGGLANRACGTYDTDPSTFVKNPDTGKLKPRSRTEHEPVTPEHWLKHLAGEKPLGRHPLGDDSMCSWGAADFDGNDGDYATFDLVALAKKIAELNLPLILCESKSGGAHAYMFLAEPTPARMVRAMLARCVEQLGFKVGQHVDLFPSADAMEPGRDERGNLHCTGSWLNMPYYGDARCAIRADASKMTAEEFLDDAGHLKANTFIVEHANDHAARPKKAYENGGGEGNRFNYVKSEIARYLAAHPRSNFEQLASYAEFVRENVLDPRPDDATWNEWRIPKLLHKLLGKQSEKGERDEPERAKTRDELILDTVTEIRANSIIAVDAVKQVHEYNAALGRYEFDDHEKFTTILQENFRGNKYRFAISKGDKDRMLLHLALGTQKFWADPPRDRINLGNGILNLKTMALEPHSPDFLFPNQFDVAWDPKAECPLTDKFLNDILHPDEVIVFYEIVGYLLTPDTDFQTAFLLHGLGGNGKSMFLEIIKHILGKRNYSTLTLHRLEGNNFAAYGLVGKLANIEADLSDNVLPGSQLFKSVVGGDAITVEKKYADAQDGVKLNARMVVSCNRYPRSRDNSPGFFRKWLVLDFTKRNFAGADANARVHATKLLEPIFAEAPGILVKAVKALQELQRRGQFTETERMKAAKSEFKCLTDSVSAWLDENTITAPRCSARQADLRLAYNVFCDAKGYPRLSANEFSEKVREYRPEVRNERGAQNELYFVGIGLKSDQRDEPWVLRGDAA